LKVAGFRFKGGRGFLALSHVYIAMLQACRSVEARLLQWWILQGFWYS